MTQEAMKLALGQLQAGFVGNAMQILREALAEHAMQEVQRLGQEIEPDDIASILACRDMLDAQPVPQRTEQEPVCPDCKAKVLYECVACSSNNYPPKTKQELCKYGQEPKSCTSSPMDCQCAIDAALAQPERTWVGLTDEEYDEIWRLDLNNKDIMDRTIAKLKQLNT